MSFTKVAPAGIGTEPGTSILIGDSLLHSTGIDIGSSTGVGVTIRQHGDATFTGIITASAFFGDGSGLEGVSSSGIGTPLSDDDTNVLNKAYYVNQELSIGSTVTVNHPDSAVASYTHYQDLVVTNDEDFIVANGDTFIPDILGINTSGLPSPRTGATGGRIRAGTITNAGANGAPNFPNGITVTGIVTASTLNATTNKIVVGSAVTANSTGIDVTGVVTATTFVGNLTGNPTGSGANLTNLPAANLTGTLPAISGANLTNLNGSNISSGIVTSARLGGGTASNTTFLRGDGTFQTVTSTSATATPSTGGGTVSGQRVASDLTYSSSDNGTTVVLGNVSNCSTSSIYALEISLTYMHNGSTNHGYLTGYIFQTGKTYGLDGAYYSEQHYDWYYNYVWSRALLPWDPSGTQSLSMYIQSAYNTNTGNKFFVDIANKLQNI